MSDAPESLEQFFAGYFHQDSFDDDPTWEDVVQRFKDDATRDECVVLANRIKVELLSSELTEDELGQRLWKLGAFFEPEADGLTQQEPHANDRLTPTHINQRLKSVQSMGSTK